ncbi:MAG: class I SAM-dependent methyltransferase [Anaerolineales bacterium]|nr:class I SAM-dependent methyltransferase [Anaerolineales bacterium]
MLKADFSDMLLAAVDARTEFFNPENNNAFRLFNGFTEGEPGISADLYARTLVLHNYGKRPEAYTELLDTAETTLLKRFPWIQSVVRKIRYAPSPEERNGIIRGEQPDTVIIENGVHYAINLCLNQDTSFYLDTRNLRVWIKDSLLGKSVLNMFAYTGSLGIAARVGGAQPVTNLDLSTMFLNIGKTSLKLNGLQQTENEFLRMDFWSAVKQFKQNNTHFDCIILDPPFFTKTRKAMLDLNKDTARLINKVRPLVRNEGWLVIVNNALFLPGVELYSSISGLCSDGYLALEQIIPVPLDMTGYPRTVCSTPPVDPSPFNHPTKIIVTRVFHK